MSEPLHYWKPYELITKLKMKQERGSPLVLTNQYSVAWFSHCDSPTCLFHLSLLLALCHVSQEKVSPNHKFDQGFDGDLRLSA